MRNEQTQLQPIVIYLKIIKKRFFFSLSKKCVDSFPFGLFTSSKYLLYIPFSAFSFIECHLWHFTFGLLSMKIKSHRPNI